MLCHRGMGDPRRAGAVTDVSLVRKHGFSRAEQVEHAADAFGSHLPERHPLLYGRPKPDWAGDRDLDPLIAVRARWAPEVSLVALEPFAGSTDEAAALAEALRAQTFRDAEVLIRSDVGRASFPRAPWVRRLPVALGGGTAAGALAEALRTTRGRLTMATELPLEELLGDPGLLEKVVRSFRGNAGLSALALADAGRERPVPLRLLDTPRRMRARPIRWPGGGAWSGTFPARCPCRGRSARRARPPAHAGRGDRLAAARRPRADRCRRSAGPRFARAAAAAHGTRALGAPRPPGPRPVLPGLPDDAIRRWAFTGTLDAGGDPPAPSGTGAAAARSGS